MAPRFALQNDFPPGDRKLTEPRVGKKSPPPRAPIIGFDRSRTMGLYDHLRTVLLVLTVYIIQGSYILVEAQDTSFKSIPFSSPDNFLAVDDVQYYGVENSFLLNSWAYSLSKSTSSCGSLYYKDRVRMKDAASGAVASFNTSFTFSIKGSNKGRSRGDGFAFTFRRNNSIVEKTSEGDAGGWLCLVRPDSDTQLFAVEFDTFLNPEYNDSSHSHIGVDVNSLISRYVHNCENLVTGDPFTAWIDYDGPSQRLAVYFLNDSALWSKHYKPKPSDPVIDEVLNLTDYLDEYMYVGFSASIGGQKEVHQILAWEFATSGLPEVTNSSSDKVLITAGACAAISAVLILAGIVIAKCGAG